jgi:hypothetical protein
VSSAAAVATIGAGPGVKLGAGKMLATGTAVASFAKNADVVDKIAHGR